MRRHQFPHCLVVLIEESSDVGNGFQRLEGWINGRNYGAQAGLEDQVDEMGQIRQSGKSEHTTGQLHGALIVGGGRK